MFNIQRDRIYKHTHLNQSDADRLKPIFENAFRESLKLYESRPEIRDERLRFMTEQYANRCRVAGNAGESPLNEDAKIFGGLSPKLTKLFESVSTPGNMVNMGNVANPQNGWEVNGGMWNPGYKAGTGDIPSYVFGLQSHIAMHCIGFDLMPVIAVDTPKAVVTYVDVIYGGGELDNKGENLPSYLEFESPVFTSAWLEEPASGKPGMNVLLGLRCYLSTLSFVLQMGCLSYE